MRTPSAVIPNDPKRHILPEWMPVVRVSVAQLRANSFGAALRQRESQFLLYHPRSTNAHVDAELVCATVFACAIVRAISIA